MAILPIPGIPPIPSAGTIAHSAGKAVEGDSKTTLSALVHEQWRAGETTKEGDPADKVALGLIHAESSGQADVVNQAPCSRQGDHAVGLMQICCPMHMSVAAAKDPRKNLAKARELYNAAGHSFARDWPTYVDGSWRRNQSDMTISAPGGGLGAAVDAITHPVDTIGDAISGAADAALGPFDEIASALLSPSTYLRVGKYALGGTLIIVGVFGLVYIGAKPLAKAAGKVPIPL